VNGVARSRIQSAKQNASLILQRSEGATHAPTDVSGGQIGAIEAEAYRGGAWRNAGKAVFDVESVGPDFVNGQYRIATRVNGAEVTHMRVSGRGVLINTAGQIKGSNAKLQVANSDGGAPGLAIGNEAGDGATNCAIFINKHGTVGSIQTNGASTQYYSTSDYRLKSSVTPLVGALVRNALLRPVSFTWVNGETDEGFIAHELAQAFPNAVQGDKDAISDEGAPMFQQANYLKLIAHLVACVEELKNEIADLKEGV
jgi:hypothetical protein